MTFSIFDHVQFNKTGRAICPSCLITKGEGYRKYNLSVSLAPADHGAYKCHRGCTTDQIREAIGDAKPLEKTYIPTAKPPKEVQYLTDANIESSSNLLRGKISKTAPKALQYLLDRGLDIRTIEYFKIGFTFKNFKYEDEWRSTPCLFIPYEINKGQWLGKYFPNKWLPESDRPEQQMAQPSVTARWYFTHQPEGKELWICEGEWDALLLGQKLYDQQSDITICTATCGAGGIPKDLSPLNQYDRIVIFYDLDDAGITGAKKLKAIIGDRAFIATVPAPLEFKKGFDIGDGFKEFGDRYLDMLHDAAKVTIMDEPKKPLVTPQTQNISQQLDDGDEGFFMPKQQRDLKELRAKYAHRLRKNLRGNAVELDGEMLQPDYLYLQCLERDGVVVKKDMIIDTFLMFASQNEYDPVAEYLQNCYQKYGDSTIHLLENAADRYMHTNLPIYNTYLKKTLVGAVKRTFEAGCKFETALVIYGKQGALKSTFWRVLGGDWFDDTVQGFDRDEKQKLHQYWIEEFGEIEKVSNKHDVSQIKAFLSNQNDVFRVPFGRSSRAYPRKFIIVGSTNKPDILQDSTGDRRFWIIDIYHNEQPIDIDKVREERDQLWAAAYALYKKGESVFLPREEDAVRDELNKQYRADDAWEEPVTNYVEHFTNIKMVDILKNCLEIPLERHDRKSQDRVSNILRNLGWVKVHTRTGKIWQKQESLGSLGSQPTPEPVLDVTYINNIESQNIYIGHKDVEKNCDPVTRDSCDPSKHDPKQNQKRENSFKQGDRVCIKSPHFLAGKKGAVLRLGNEFAVVGGNDWAVEQHFKLEQLEVAK